MTCEIDVDSTKRWYLNGKLHRVGGPAVERINGDRLWFQNGKRHRVGDPAIDYSNGYKAWYQNGKLHRLDGPAAVHYDGTKYWYQNNKRHRIDGPAVQWGSGGFEDWWVDGRLYHKWAALYIIATKYKQNITKLMII